MSFRQVPRRVLKPDAEEIARLEAVRRVDEIIAWAGWKRNQWGRLVYDPEDDYRNLSIEQFSWMGVSVRTSAL